MPEDDFREASAELFATKQVEALEWSFDVKWNASELPDWCNALLKEFSDSKNLLGHGVTFSPFSGGFTERQRLWLDNLRDEFAGKHYVHLSEHFGFMEAGAFVEGAPFPVPMTNSAVAVGIRCLRGLSEASGVSVGLENLALAFCLDDVKRQGEFLDRVLTPVDGFLLMDLHNLYCQSVNFDVQAENLLESYPLSMVTEIHLSGGSWTERRIGSGKPIRRDTHDGPVPEAVFAMLDMAMAKCPNLKYVILERLGGTMPEAVDRSAFRDDYLKLKRTVNARAN